MLVLPKKGVDALGDMHAMRPPSVHYQHGRRPRPDLQPLLSAPDGDVFALRKDQTVSLGIDGYAVVRLMRTFTSRA